jgi:hypothetical protein
MRTDIDFLDDVQRTTLEMLLAHPSKEDAAKALGIGLATLYRRLLDENLRRAYLDARREVVSHTAAYLQQASQKAVQTLEELHTNPQTPASVRRGAAESIISLGFKSMELEDLAAELDKLKEIVDG